jgi:lysophospholipase L1-like esterase
MPSRLLVVLAALAALLVAAAPAAAAKKKTMYVSLGDSQAWGYSKDAEGTAFQSDRGYSNLLAAQARKDRRYGRKVTLRNLSCPGENTATYLAGGRCTYKGFASQAAAARALLEKNRKRIAFVTVNIGANNFTSCAKGTAVDVSCVEEGMKNLERDLPKIYRSLRKAAGPKAKIVAATQYNPYLYFWLRPGDYRQLALLSDALAKQVNQRLTTAARAKAAKLRIADVYKAFKAGVLDENTTHEGAEVPVAVAELCRLTLMCRPAPVGPDIHPSDAGYALMAKTFAKALGIRKK